MIRPPTVHVIRVGRDENPVDDARREWLVTNGLGALGADRAKTNVHVVWRAGVSIDFSSVSPSIW